MMQAEPVAQHEQASMVRRGAALISWLCTPRVYWILFAVIAALRLQAIARLQLVPDEAYYWVWTRHLSLSYFDHPPMVAWLIWLSTRLLGTSEFAVRLPAALMSIASIPVMMLAARAVIEDRAAIRLAGLILLVSTVTTVSGTVTTPDSPAWFFGTCSIAAACWAVRLPDPRRAAMAWIAFGLLLGLALLSKYTSALIGPAVFLGLAASREGRRHLLKPWFWCAAAICIACFAPVLIWNIRHDWPSFRFQLNHGFGEDKIGPLKGIGEYIGGQMLAWTPLMLIVSGAAVWALLRKLRTAPAASHILLACFAFPAILFLYSASRRRVEVNWPFLMYAPLAVITAVYIAEKWQGRRAAIANVAICCAAVIVVGLQSPLAVKYLGSRIRKLAQGQGYAALGREVHRLAEGRPVFANRYQEASELSFYMPGRPDIWALNVGGSRTNMFDYFEGKPDVSKVKSAIFVNCRPQEVSKDFVVLQSIEWPTEIFGRVMRRDRIDIAERREVAP